VGSFVKNFYYFIIIYSKTGLMQYSRSPNAVLILTLLYVGIVIILHIFGKLW
jgi:hypothetical protein